MDPAYFIAVYLNKKFTLYFQNVIWSLCSQKMTKKMKSPQEIFILSSVCRSSDLNLARFQGEKKLHICIFKRVHKVKSVIKVEIP